MVENQCYDPGKLEAGFELADHAGPCGSTATILCLMELSLV